MKQKRKNVVCGLTVYVTRRFKFFHAGMVGTKREGARVGYEDQMGVWNAERAQPKRRDS